MVPRGRTEPGHFGVLASVGLGVCARESLVAPPWRMDGLAICPRGVPTPLWGPGSGDGSGLQGEGAGRKEAEAARGGRVTVAMEGAARYSGIRILSAEKEGAGWGGLGKVMGSQCLSFVLDMFLHPHRWRGPLTPPELAPSSPLPVLPVRLMYRRQSGPFQEACLPARQRQISALKRHSEFIPANKLTAMGACDAFSLESAETGFAVLLNRLPSTHHIKCV